MGRFGGPLGAVVGHPGGFLGVLGGVLGLFWGVREASDAPLVDIWRPLVAIMAEIMKSYKNLRKINDFWLPGGLRGGSGRLLGAS